MAGDIKLKAGSTQTLANANGPAVSNDAAGAAGTDLDNTTALAEYVSFELDAGFGSSVTALEDVDLYLVPKLDGTNAAAVDTSTPRFQPSHYAGTFYTPTTGTSARRMTVEGVQIGPFKYTAYLWNKSGQSIPANWTLKAFEVLGSYT
jgi:hypothetical protein